MPLQKIVFKSGVNKENTRYTTEGGWYDCDKVRFRQGTPEKLGGWQRISTATFLGVCRSLWAWVTLGAQRLMGVGTNEKFYIEQGGQYYDITPLSVTHTLGTDPFATDTATNTGTTTTVTVTDASGGVANGTYVTFSGATTVAGLDLNGEYQITVAGTSTTTYTITVAGTAASTTTGGGSAVRAMYQVPIGPAYALPLTGWGAGGWGLGAWGIGTNSTDSLRIWNQTNFGEDLLYGPVAGPLYYWNATIGTTGTVFTITIASPGVITTTISLADGEAVSLLTTGALPTGLTVGTLYYVVNSTGTTFNLAATPGGAAINTSGTQSGIQSFSTRGVPITSLAGASDAPISQNFFTVSDVSRFVICFGTNDTGTTTVDPLLIRWSDQESITDWTPTATNQAGSIRISHGSRIVTAMQNRQEIVVWTDSSVYSMQYLGPPYVWNVQLLADNISITGINAPAIAAGVIYWMGVDKFYKYDGRVQTLRCDLRQYIYNDINLDQADQFFASTNEGFNEVWFFYCSSGATSIDRYVVYNYFENNGEGAWYYGNMSRSAWLDSGLRNYPMAATSLNNIVYHEYGTDNNETDTTVAIDALIASAEFDIDDGDHFGFVWRILPDITFSGSTGTETPQVTMTLIPMQNSGSGYNDPISVGGNSTATVSRTSTAVIEQFTGQVYVRVRGRQMIMQVESNTIGTQWQLGSPRIDIRTDGRRGNS